MFAGGGESAPSWAERAVLVRLSSDGPGSCSWSLSGASCSPQTSPKPLQCWNSWKPSACVALQLLCFTPVSTPVATRSCSGAKFSTSRSRRLVEGSDVLSSGAARGGRRCLSVSCHECSAVSILPIVAGGRVYSKMMNPLHEKFTWFN